MWMRWLIYTFFFFLHFVIKRGFCFRCFFIGQGSAKHLHKYGDLYPGRNCRALLCRLLLFREPMFASRLMGSCFSQDLVFLRWSRGSSQPVRARFYLKASVQKRSARMGLTRLQKGPGWEREWAWTTFLTSVALVRPPAGNGSEYFRFEALPRFVSNVLHACKCAIRGLEHRLCEIA